MKLRERSAPPLAVLVLLTVAVLVVLGLTFIGAAVLDKPVAQFVRDPLVVLEGNFTTGILSSFGAALWFCAGTASALAGAVLRRSGRAGGTPLLLASLLSIVLGLDDLLVVHEALFEKFGIPEPVTFSVYGGGALAIGYVYRAYWAHTEFVVLTISLFFLAASVGVDVFFSDRYALDVLEDCFKFAGISAWALYAARTAYAELLPEPGPS